MTEYKIDKDGDVIFVTAYDPTDEQKIGRYAGGPYKTEESAKRRIRDLKRKDLIRVMITDDGRIAPAEVVQHASDHMREIEQRPADNTHFNDAGASVVVMSQSNWVGPEIGRRYYPIRGVYPAVPKKLYRHAWR